MNSILSNFFKNSLIVSYSPCWFCNHGMMLGYWGSTDSSSPLCPWNFIFTLTDRHKIRERWTVNEKKGGIIVFIKTKPNLKKTVFLLEDVQLCEPVSSRQFHSMLFLVLLLQVSPLINFIRQCICLIMLSTHETFSLLWFLNQFIKFINSCFLISLPFIYDCMTCAWTPFSIEPCKRLRLSFYFNFFLRHMSMKHKNIAKK